MTRQSRTRGWVIAAICVPLAVLAPACSAPSTPAPAPSATSSPATSASAQPTGAPSSAGASGGSKTSSGPSAPPTTPTPGSVDQTVPPVAQSTQKPVKLDGGSSRFHKGLDVRVSDVGTKKVSAKLPGEVSGDGVLFTVTVKNGSSTVVDLNSLVVNVLDAKAVPASRITTSPAKPMPNAVAAGGSARGRYVFVVPKGARKPISVEVSLAAGDPVLVFRGSAG